MKEAASVAERASVLMLKIFKGDDTGGMFGKHISIKVESPFPLTNCTILFDFLGIQKTFTNVTVGEFIEIFFTHNETKCMKEGVSYARMLVIDPSGKGRTITNSIAIKVTTDVAECYGTDGQSITVQIGVVVDWTFVTNKPTINGHALVGDLTGHDLGLADTADIPDFNGEMIPIFTDDELREALKKVIVKLGGQTNI